MVPSYPSGICPPRLARLVQRAPRWFVDGLGACHASEAHDAGQRQLSCGRGQCWLRQGYVWSTPGRLILWLLWQLLAHNTLIAPYLPSKFQINSTDQFLDILRATDKQGIMASIDVESLFTNVPVGETIDIICDNVYRNQELPPLSIPENILRDLLKLCTTECPFQNFDGKIYQ